jgi:hypothetical protein
LAAKLETTPMSIAHGDRRDAGHERQPDRRQAQLASLVAGRLRQASCQFAALRVNAGWEVMKRAKTRTF